MKKKNVVIECIEACQFSGLNEGCPKIEVGGTCETYANPRAIQHRMGRLDACGVMPRPIKEVKKIKTKGQGKTKAGGNR
jgi:hypothetical protein